VSKRVGLPIAAALLLFWAWSVPAVEMKAGTAKGVITPGPDKALISVMGKPLEGVEHDIFSRVLVLDDGAHRLIIVANDLNCLDVATPILRERLKNEFGTDPAYFVPLATHNHAAPIQIVPGNFDYGRWLAERIFGLIKEAIANEQGPAQVQFGFGSEYCLKCMGNAPIDSEIQVLKVTSGDKVLAVLFNQATHPLQTGSKAIEVGHPGYAVDEVESRLPGVLALYADACGGNQFTSRGMKASIENVKAFAHQVADRALAISQGPMQDVTGPIASKLEVISLPLAKPIPREDAEKLAASIPKDIGLVPYPDKNRSKNWVRALLKCYQQNIPFPTKSDEWVCTDDAFLVKEYETPRAYPCRYEETITAKIGPLVFVAMQGEVCAPIGMRIKDAFRSETPIMVCAYMGEHNLYIPTREIVRLGLYQAQVIQTQYACPVGWAPEVEDDMVTGVTRMITALMQQP